MSAKKTKRAKAEARAAAATGGGGGGGSGATPRPRPRRSPIPLPPLALVLVLLVAAGYVLFARTLLFTQDDAYISFRYAKNLLDGHGLVFNPGERVEGYSNFAWTMLVAFVMKLGADPVPASQVMGLAFGVLAILTAARFVRGLEGRWGAGAVAAAAFIAFNPAFALWSSGGLETAMFAFLVVLGLERGLAPDVSPAGRRLAPLALAAASLTRPEGPLLFVLWFAVRAFDTWRAGPCADPAGRRGLVRDALTFAAPLVPYALWKLWYFGDLLPNPFYAKTGTSLEHLRLGFAYARDFFGAFGAWGVPLLLGAASVLRTGLRGIEARLLAIWCVWASYVVLVGGDVLYMHRFWLHVLPVGAVLLGRGLTETAARFARSLPGAAREILAAAVCAALVTYGIRGNLAAAHDRRNTESAFVLNMRQTGEWLGENLPKDATIAITTIGAISYFSGVRVIDMLGLTDYEVAHHPNMVPGLTDTWRETQYNAESVLERRPDFIFFSTGIRPSSAAEKALFLYPWFLQNYYGYYFRSKPHRESLQNGFRIREDAPPFDATRLPADDVRWLELYGEAHLAKSKERDNAKAVELFRQCAEIAPPQFTWAKEWLAVCMYDGGDPASLPLLQEAADADPHATIARGRLADRAMQVRDLEAAERLFHEILAVDPDDNLPWIGLAELTRTRGDLDGAYRLTREAIARWNVNPIHLVLYGSLASAAGDLDVADAAFARALAAGASGETEERANRGLELVKALREGRVKVSEVREAMQGSPAADSAAEGG